MERRKIRKEEEKEREKKKKELKKSFRKKEKGKVRFGLSKVTVAKIIVILVVIITPIVIFFVYQYFESEKEPQYSFLTEGDFVYGTWINGNKLNFTHIKTKIAFASTVEFMSMEISDNYPYDSNLYKAVLKSTFHSVLAIPYDVHPHDHYEDPDSYVEFAVGFIHNVPDLFYVLRSTDEVIYPSVLEWYYILNGTDLEDLTTDQNEFFFNPEISVDPSDRELKKDTDTEIHVNVTIKAGYSKGLGMTEMTMTFKDNENLTFTDAEVFIGGLGGRPGYYTFKSRKSRVGTFSSMYLDFNITVNSNQTFTSENILSSGSISFQFKGRSLRNVYPSRRFGSIKLNVLGIPDEDQIEAFIYMIRQKYINFHIDIPLNFTCTPL
ncbi:MAG: hypothetical protein HWN67_00790 [Candidatus Helarchaeota archaeon]|nr:hypothetical protein [Candidatus Helarchaeota archaeon]